MLKISNCQKVLGNHLTRVVEAKVSQTSIKIEIFRKFAFFFVIYFVSGNCIGIIGFEVTKFDAAYIRIVGISMTRPNLVRNLRQQLGYSTFSLYNLYQETLIVYLPLKI